MWSHPPPTSHHPNKKKVSGVKSEILINIQRIKWTPSGNASHIPPREIKSEIGVSKLPYRTMNIEAIFEKIIPSVWFWKRLRNSLASWKYSTHKKIYFYLYTHISTIITIIKKNRKLLQVGHHPPSIHHLNKWFRLNFY